MGFVYAVHLVVCVLLVIAILMQAGRGGGLTETFQSAESMFGTQTNAFMVRLTTVLAVIFLSTSLFLAMHSSKANKSLMTNAKMVGQAPKPAAPTQAEPQVQVKVGTPKPAAPAEATGAPEVPVKAVTNAAK